MTDQKQIAPHSYTVALRFYGEQLVPSEISAQLSLQPSHFFNQSQNEAAKRKRTPFWGYNGQGAAGFHAEWENLDLGMSFLLNTLKFKKSEIITLANQFDAVWWVGHFQSSFDGGPTLSPRLMAEISEYQIPLSIDNYFNDE